MFVSFAIFKIKDQIGLLGHLQTKFLVHNSVEVRMFLLVLKMIVAKNPQPLSMNFLLSKNKSVSQGRRHAPAGLREMLRVHQKLSNLQYPPISPVEKVVVVGRIEGVPTHLSTVAVIELLLLKK
jgi:hypothetical protein